LKSLSAAMDPPPASRAAPGRLALGRVPFLVLGFISLLIGIAAGLVRLGWSVPAVSAAAAHGPLMVVGFLGTVIGLERAVALGTRWGFGAPLAAALAALGAVAGFAALSAVAAIAAAVLLLAIALTQAIRHPSPHTWTMAIGAAAWACGNVAWAAGLPLDLAIAWWCAFLVLTIAGERLELARVLQPPPLARVWFALAIGTLLAGSLLVTLSVAFAWPVIGAALVLLTAWMAHYDVARRTVRQSGLTRYVAWCLLIGYAWLAAAGVLWLLGAAEAPLARDAALHALLVGFVFSMIFGHAPLIFPAVLRVRLPFTPWLYLPFAVLHVSLLARVGGDLIADAALRAWGGLGHAAAIALFLVTMVSNALRRR
jgi:hypothetical protein